jgi:hypothetical protein
MSPAARLRLIAYYLPQFHPIPENDAWWGQGFTEWTNVAKARPMFKGHYQPHIPADLGFYDLRLPEARQAQAEMARQYGIEGFCYWHYWFAGKRLLERPFNDVLRSGKPDFPFCLAWANQTWSGTWHGAPERVLIEQTYPGLDDHTAHFQALLPAFQDQRYILVDGKPVFFIFQPARLDRETVELWRDLADRAGLKGLFLVGIINDTAEGIESERMGFDACTISRTSGRGHHENPLIKLLLRLGGETRVMSIYQKLLQRPFRVYPYRNTHPYVTPDGEIGLEFFPCVIPNWDNTPRAGANGIVFTHSTPALFQKNLHQAFQCVKDYPPQHRIVILKSWNEWAEGNHLEPDLKFGRGYLEAIQDEITNFTPGLDRQQEP